jgi:hypothetical protein
MRLGGLLDDAGKLHAIRRSEEGPWVFDEDDYLLFALLCDPIYHSELLCEDPTNHDYGGAYVVRDYQYPLFRVDYNYAGITCARAVGKSESIKARSCTHAFRRIGENLLLTAPELIHLLPLTDAVEDRIRSVRLLREFLDTRGQKSGFTHRPFGVDFADGTKIVGRIPRLTGTGIKGQHEPDLIIDEANDYPEKGWVEVHERLRLATPVPTLDGWTTIGGLRLGDQVFARDGWPTRVVGLSKIERRPTYRVVLDDGEEIVTDGDHRWTVTVNRYLRDGKWLTKTTAEMAADLEKPGKAFGSPGQPWLLPDVGPVQRRPRDLALDPYTLGALLGDGTMRHGNLALSVPPEKEWVRMRMRLPRGDRWSARKAGDRCPSYGIAGGATKEILTSFGLYGKLSPDRFIPAVYLDGSVDQRLELLRGLIDTDGNVHRSGALRYATSSDRLKDQVCELVASLGGRWSAVAVRNADHEDGWCVHIRLELEAATRPDMRERMRPASNDKLRRRIVAVEPTGQTEPVRCVMVDHPQHLFLVGRTYVPTRNTVQKDHVDADGRPDFTYHFYGVHTGARDTGFYRRASEGGFRIVQVTAIQRPGWGNAEKQAAKAAYGGTSSSDYRRNILGEPGAAASAFFVTARLFACVDQDRDSHYNQAEYVHQVIRVEEFDELMLPIAEVLDLPAGVRGVSGGMDVGLTNAPTEIVLFTRQKVGGVERRKLFRRFTLERMRTRQIRAALYAIDEHFGSDLVSFGSDVTGLGFPIFQEIEDDEDAPPHLLDIHRGYFFNAKVPVGVEAENVRDDGRGNLRDQYGHAVVKEIDPNTGGERFVVHMPMIEAATRYMREDVDQTIYLLPFDPAITADMQGETQQRVKRIAGLKQKPNAFHILDAMRAEIMADRAGTVEAKLAFAGQEPVLDMAIVD